MKNSGNDDSSYRLCKIVSIIVIVALYIALIISMAGIKHEVSAACWKDEEAEEGTYYLGDYSKEIEYVSYNESTTENQYNEHWEYWSQGASMYRLTKYGGRGCMTGGCMVTAFSKLLVESGIASGDVNEFNPDIFYEWGMERGHYNGVSATMYGHSYDTYAEEHETVLVRNDAYLPSNIEEKVEFLMENLKEGKYIVLIRHGHYVYVLREASLEAGTIIVSDSASSYSQNANSVYSLTSSKYNFYACMMFDVYFQVSDEEIINEDGQLITYKEGSLPIYIM